MDQLFNVPMSPAASSATHNVHDPLIGVPLKPAKLPVPPCGLYGPALNGATPAVILVAAVAEKQVPA